MDDDLDPRYLEDPDALLDEVQDLLQDGQKRHMGIAQDYGYAGRVLEQARPQFRQMAQSSTSSEQDAELYRGTIATLGAFRNTLREIETHTSVPQSLHLIPATAYSLATGTSASSDMMQVANVDIVTFQVEIEAPPATMGAADNYAERFERADPALGKAYRAIDEALYGTVSDPERTATFMARQAYDQLFAHLAPDDELRKSEFFHKKEGDRPDQIFRAERVEFAAHRLVKDSEALKILIASSKQMLKVRDGLDEAHSRKLFNRDEGVRLLTAMKAFLRLWADAVGI